MAAVRILFVGGGKMAEAIFSGIIAKRIVPEDRITVVEHCVEQQVVLSLNYPDLAVFSCLDPRNLVDHDVIILAVKPQDLRAAVEGMALTKRHLVISIAAGVSLATLRGYVGVGPRLIRVMPNLPLAVGEGMTAYCADSLIKDKKLVERIFSALGAVSETPEGEFDAVTGLSGSGPAFIAWVVKAFAGAAAKAGLAEEVAEAFALQTLLGTAMYLTERSSSLDDFIAAVSSKGGTTQAGIDALESSGCVADLQGAILAAAARSAELNGGK